MASLAGIIEAATVPAQQATARLKLFPATGAAGDVLFAALAEEGLALIVTRERECEITVGRAGRAWISIETAFSTAREVRALYRLEVCEPDVAVPVMPADGGRPSERSGEESVDALTPGCWAPEEPDLRERKNWAISLIKADRAWAFAKGRGLPSGGAGIVVAQPDTGITDHVELRGVPLRAPLNLLDGGDPGDPTDPLSAAGNPGHGTGTASVLISRSSGYVTGSAPNATLMPIRAIERVVQPSMVKVAEAVDHAVESGAHVITMSLGGVWSYSLWAAIERAVAADVIVMAAAGNCVGIVVWPAQFEACLGVAAVDQHSAPWRGTSKGFEVDIAAPGQNVYRANAKTGDVGQGQGTSFAVALTAGVAACWLACHGRSALVAAAHQRGETLQAMFRRLLQATAQRPATWDATRMGAGIVDAAALLAADLDLGRGTEGPVRPRLRPVATRSLEMLAVNRIGTAALDPTIDWKGYGGELSRDLIAGAASAADLPGRVAAPVAHAPREASAELRRAQRLRDRIIAADKVAEGAGQESLGALESAGGEPMTTAMADRIVERMISGVRNLPSREIQDPQAVAAALDMLALHGRNALEKLTGLTEAQAVRFSRDDLLSLEAIVSADGSRPSFLLDGGRPPVDHPFMGGWSATVGRLRDTIGTLAKAVGRIQPGGGHNGYFVGTGVLVDAAKGVILTNYHVLDDAITKFFVPSQRTGEHTIRFLGPFEIDFLGEANSLRTNRFRIVEATLHPDSGRGFGRLDAVTMTIEPLSGSGELPDSPVRFSAQPIDFTNAQGSDFCTIGFPGRPDVESDPSGKVNWDFVIRTLFGGQFGVKRLAPGRVTGGVGSRPEDTMQAVFGHDATTFGGASGSPTFAWNVDGQPAIGLHFAGQTRESNYALTSAVVGESFRALGVPISDGAGA